jgi:hypothetical protein
MRRSLAAVATVFLVAALGGCGRGDDAPAPTTTTTVPATTTTGLPQGDAQGIACLRLSTQALALFNDFRAASRGIVAPDPEPYRQQAEALRAEHARLGCPGELLAGFP